MIRITVREVDVGEVAHVSGGQAQTKTKSFDCDLPELQVYLEAVRNKQWVSREVVGYELLPDPLMPQPEDFA